VSTAAILWTHDDRDVLEATIRHLLAQVDEVLVRHRREVPEVEDILLSLIDETDSLRLAFDKGEFGFQQAKLMSDLAQEARKRGHAWVVPVDPDELWYANGSTLSEFLAGISRDVGIVQADLFNHVVTTEDDPSLHPFDGIGWRQRAPLPLPKVAARAHRSLKIEGGNHGARISGVPFTVGPQLVVRHFPYRTEDQFIRKVATNYAHLKEERRLPAGYGAHIRHYGKHLEESGEQILRDHFQEWFLVREPRADPELIYDPAPYSR